MRKNKTEEVWGCAMKRIFKGLAAILFGSIFFGIVALADRGAAVMRTYTGDSSLSVYIKGAELKAEDLNIQIATTEAEQFSLEPISELDRPMRTLVMLDNSLSISEESRKKAAQILQNLVADRMSGEEISITTFGESLNVLTDYTDDYTILKQVIDGIVYQNQETYLTDVLYELISERYKDRTEDIYERIVIISDGVDNKSLGYTKEELYSLLEKYPIPIYTIGCVNKKNDDELENMFALSRMTCAEYFLLDEIEDPLLVEEVLKEDRNIVRVIITPSREVMDGSKKTVRITGSGDVTLTVETVMPQMVAAREVSAETASEKIPEMQTEEAEVQTMSTGVEETGGSHAVLPIALLALAAVLVIVLIVCIVLLARKPGGGNGFDPFVEGKKAPQPNPGQQPDKTTLIDRHEGKSGTLPVLPGGKNQYQLTLTDIHSPAKTFSVPIHPGGSVLIGYKRDTCDIALDYDRSVSRQHCRITMRDSRFYIEDLHSSNGTYVGENRVVSETEIIPGCILTLGGLELRFDVK